MLSKKFLFIDLLPVLIFAIITSIVIFSWFRYGYLYGGGDVGFPSYNPTRILEITKNIWWETSAPGTTVPHGLTSVPFQYFQYILQNLGLPSFLIQAVVFWILLFLSGFGMYLLGLTVFEKNKYYLAILAGLFYMFNPYMMVQVWHRFIHNAFFLSAALPFLFIFFRSWVQTGRYSALLLFLLTNFIAVYLYGTIAFIVTIFILLLFICMVEIIFPWKGFSVLRIVSLRTLFGVTVWLAAHSWWLLPVLSVSPATLSSQHSVIDNLSTLLSISWQTIIPYSLLGINPHYLYIEADFGKIFDTYFFRLLPWLSLVFLVPGFIMALKNKKWAIWAILAVVGIFLSKGPASPFGYPYIFGFSNFFPLGVLRNPFEKLGILMIFSYAILFPIGIQWYLENTGKKIKQIVRFAIPVILILILVVNIWPMWLGKMFGKYNKLAFIGVPDSYLKADEYIRNQNKTGRILHLPLSVSEAINYYYWDHGYSGVEPSQLLFTSLPSISHGFNLGIVDDALTALSQIFVMPSSESNILSILQSFNTKFIILHKDIQWRGGYLPEPQKLESLLDRLSFLEREIQLGDLIIYELKDEYFNPKIKITSSTAYLIPAEKNTYWPWLLSNKQDLLSPINSDPTTLMRNAEEIIIFPEHTYKHRPETIERENLLGQMPAAKILPNSLLYPLIRLKEKVQYFRLPIFDKFPFKVTLMGKRLTESYLLKVSASTKSIIPQLKEYQKLLPEIKDEVKVRSNGNEPRGEISINFIMLRHLAMLNLIREKVQESEIVVIDEVIKQLTDFLKETNILPHYAIATQLTQQLASRIVSIFNLPASGDYELLQASQGSQHIYPNNLSKNKFQTNNDIRELEGLSSDNFISYGTVNLTDGLNEISFDSIPSINLAESIEHPVNGIIKDSNQEIEIVSGEHDPTYLEINIEPVLGGSFYQLTFDSWIKLGDKFKVEVHQDTDPDDPKNPGEKLHLYYEHFVKHSYRNYWNDHFFNFFINPTTTKAILRIIVAPWDDCRNYEVKKILCLDKSIRYSYEQPSQIVFRNIKMVRSLTNPLFLRAKLPNAVSAPTGMVSFNQKNAVTYSGNMNLISPGFLVFNETYHPGWKLELFNGEKITLTKRYLSNIYANAWYIEKPGSYNFTLEFTPQENVRNGIIISTICLFLVTALVVNQRLRK